MKNHIYRGELTEMDDNIKPYLCGGIFFSLLIELHNNTARGYNPHWGKKNTINQAGIMQNLIQVIEPEYKGHPEEKSFTRAVAEYRACKNGGGNIFPFDHGDRVSGFIESVERQYKEVLKRMKEFTDKSFPGYNSKPNKILLIERTLIIIRNDNHIDDDDLFYINDDGSPISKKQLLEKEDFNFESFLVGIWHYIIAKPTTNIDGKEFFLKLFQKVNKRLRLVPGLLGSYTHKIIIKEETEVSEESSSKEVNGHEDTAKIAEANKNEKLEVKVFYEGDWLEEDEKEKILSNSPEIIDLNEHPDISIKDYPNPTIYKITTEFQFEPSQSFLGDKLVILHYKVDSLNISGTTSKDRWKSRSQIDKMIGNITYPCTAWFSLVPQKDEYSAYFLMIGGMWDDQKHGSKDEIMKIFKEKYILYEVYKFIPKDIKNVIESLKIYHEMLDENAKLVMQEDSTSDCETAHNPMKMYCKWYPGHDNFIFCAVVRCNGFWRLQIPEEHILLKSPESFEHDMRKTDTWINKSIEYAIVNIDTEGEQFNGEELPWKKCQGDIIVIERDIPTKTKGSANKSIPAKTIALINENAIADQDTSASEDIPDDEDYPIIEDCYELIDGMLELDSSIDEFVAIIEEKIIIKYEGVNFDDNLRQLYNDIKLYRNLLKEFKNCLIKYRNLEKVKSEYLSDQAFIKQFGMYSAFSDHEPVPKPHYSSSELYLDPEEAHKVKSELDHYHQNLIELYTEIIGWEGDHTV